jgi:hypothetical protein
MSRSATGCQMRVAATLTAARRHSPSVMQVLGVMLVASAAVTGAPQRVAGAIETCLGTLGTERCTCSHLMATVPSQMCPAKGKT